MWCHVLLALPFLGLGMFVLLPWTVALPSYLVVLAASLALYTKIIDGMRKPVRTGREAMLGALVTVITDIASRGQVRYHNETWRAISKDRIEAGEQAQIVGFQGLRLIVGRLDDSQHKESTLKRIGRCQ